MQEIPDEMSLLWIANFTGTPPNELYRLNRAGLGPVGKKVNGRYRVSKASLLVWLATKPTGVKNHD